MSDNQITALSRKYFRDNCRVSYVSPELMIRALFNVYCFFLEMEDPLRTNHKVLVSNHRSIMLKEMKYVQGGRNSDPPEMNMYRCTGFFKCSGRRKWRSLRNTSPLEASYLHFSRSRHPTAKSAGPKSTQIHSNMWDFNWSLNAAAKAKLMRTIYHHQPWLIDMIAKTCHGWIAEDELPPLVQGWAAIDTTIPPCTFRGIDWEVYNLERADGNRRINISMLRSEEDIRKVCEYPELVIAGDWPQLARLTGVYTDAKRLQDLATRVIHRELSNAVLNERGLQRLLDELRKTDGGHAPSATVPLGMLPATDLRVPGPLPLQLGRLPPGRQSVVIDHTLPAVASPVASEAGGDDGGDGGEASSVASEAGGDDGGDGGDNGRDEVDEEGEDGSNGGRDVSPSRSGSRWDAQPGPPPGSAHRPHSAPARSQSTPPRRYAHAQTRPSAGPAMAETRAQAAATTEAAQRQKKNHRKLYTAEQKAAKKVRKAAERQEKEKQRKAAKRKDRSQEEIKDDSKKRRKRETAAAKTTAALDPLVAAAAAALADM